MSGVFVPVDRDQTFLLAFDFRVLLGEDHLVWTVIDVVESLDLSMLYARYGDHPDGGRPAFDPKMMLSLLVYAYCHGLRSSRQIEGACRTDFVYRAITANQEPDHATIARFRASLDSFLASLFSQVLSICRELGLGKVGLVAIDGTRMEASASKEANRTRSRLLALEAEAREMLSEAEAADSADEQAALSPRRRGGPEERLARIREAKARLSEGGSTGRRGGGPEEGRSVNLTDPDSRLMKTRSGFIQGFNAQAVASEDQLVVAATVTNSHTDVGLLAPMLTEAQTNLSAARVTEPIEVVVADAGYYSEENSRLSLGPELLIATGKGHRVGLLDRPSPKPSSIPTLVERAAARLPVVQAVVEGELSLVEAAATLDLSYSHTAYLVIDYRSRGEEALALRRQPNRGGRSPRPPSSATLARQEMEAKLALPQNLARYKKRSHLIEGVFAHVKWHRGVKRFSRRGLIAVDAEWKLICLAGNIRKVHQRTKPTPADNPPPDRPPIHTAHHHPRCRRHLSKRR